MKIHCGVSSQMTIKMQFSVGKCITAGRSEEPNTIVALEKLRNCLEQCLLHRLEHVETMRDEFDLLNYFKRSQLTSLRTELTTFNAKNKLKQTSNIRSHDFALPSLEISDRSALQIDNNFVLHFNIEQVQMRRKWQNHPHPYLFFNPDGQTFTFFGFNVNHNTGELIDPNTQQRLFTDIRLSRDLITGINLQDRSLLVEDISRLSKTEKISKILHVMGKKWASSGTTHIRDPDVSYELTMDNVLKIMAIFMRFRCDIPVIICGETGCGKTALIKYLCDLQIHPDRKNIKNLYLVKVHGGVTSADIARHVEEVGLYCTI